MCVSESTRRCCDVVAVLMLALAWSAGARADAERWELRWEAPEGCPSEQAVRSTVEAWLAQSAEPIDASGVRVDGRVERDEHGFKLDLELETPSGSARERLVAETCETLAGVVALKVALATDVEGEPSEQGAGVVWGVRASGGASAGVLPELAPTLALSGVLQLGALAFELAASYGFATEARYAARPEIGARLDVLAGGARLCALPDLGAVEFPLCAGVDLGLMRGRGFGVPDTTASSQWYASLVIAPALRVPITGPLLGWLGFEALVPWLRPRFHVRNLGRLYESPALGARVQIGIELRIE